MTTPLPKPRFRVPVSSMMVSVVVFALGFAALARPTEMAVSLVVTVAFTILLGSICMALQGSKRSFSLGFAVFGWGYLFLATGIVTESEPRVSRHLLTTKFLISIHDQVFPGEGSVRLWDFVTDRNPAPPAKVGMVFERGTPVQYPPSAGRWTLSYEEQSEHRSRFLKIGHFLLALTSGLVGGLWLVWVDKRQQKSRDEPS